MAKNIRDFKPVRYGPARPMLDLFPRRGDDPVQQMSVKMVGNGGRESEWVEVQCKTCGKKFMAHPEVAFCSSECSRKGREDGKSSWGVWKRGPEPTDNYKAENRTGHCIICGKPVPMGIALCSDNCKNAHVEKIKREGGQINSKMTYPRRGDESA